MQNPDSSSGVQEGLQISGQLGERITNFASMIDDERARGTWILDARTILDLIIGWAAEYDLVESTSVDPLEALFGIGIGTIVGDSKAFNLFSALVV